MDVAENLVGKTVYCINYVDKLIVPTFVESSQEVSITSKGVFIQKTTSDKSIKWEFKETQQEADEALVQYYEIRLDVANSDYQEALRLVGL